MKTPKERGPVGLWLYETRRKRGFSNAETARQAIARATGVNMAASVYAQYEAGTRKVSARHMQALEAFWGPMPSEDQPAATGDVGRLMGMVSDLVEQIKAEREERRAERHELLALVRRLLPPQGGAQAQPPATPPSPETAADIALAELASREMGEAGAASLRAVPATPSLRRIRPEGTRR